MQISFGRVFLFLLAGPLIWAMHFLLIYAINGVNCARPGLISDWLGLALSSWLILAASLLALGIMTLTYLRWRTRMPQVGYPGFLPWLAGMLSVLSAVAIIWETIPVLLTPACA